MTTTAAAARRRTDDVLRVAAILAALDAFYRPPTYRPAGRHQLTPLGRAVLAHAEHTNRGRS